MALILESSKDDLKQWIEGTIFVLKSRCSVLLLYQKQRIFAHMTFSYGVLVDQLQRSGKELLPRAPKLLRSRRGPSEVSKRQDFCIIWGGNEDDTPILLNYEGPRSSLYYVTVICKSYLQPLQNAVQRLLHESKWNYCINHHRRPYLVHEYITISI